MSFSLHHRLTSLRQDLLASVVVFFIALPFSLGVALASGTSVGAALVPGAIAAIVAGLLGGAPFVVTGPAASVAVLVFELGEDHGLAAIGAATALAGLLQLGLAALRAGRLAEKLPLAVVHGMLAGVGVTMAASQARVLLGASPTKSFVDNLLSLPALLVSGNHQAALLGAATLALLLAWPKFGPRALPAALVAIATATLADVVLHLTVPTLDLPDQLFALGWPQLPQTELLAWLSGALAIGLIASTESLLSAVAVDRLHDGPRARLDRELLGQGAANLVSGLLGGLPVTGGSVRSTANLQAQAQSRVSTVLHGVWLVAAASFLADYLEYVPLSALAALLLLVSLRMVRWEHWVTFARSGELTAYLVTLGGVLGFGLLWGIALGMATNAGLGVLRGQRPRQPTAPSAGPEVKIVANTWPVEKSAA